MVMTDPLGDMLTRIRNAQGRSKSSVSSPASRLREGVLEVLKREGYIRDFERLEIRKGVYELKISLKYHEGKPVIQKIRRVSKPGCRVYSEISNLLPVYNGLGISILSTSQGIVSDLDARKSNIGGEVLLTVL